MTFQRALKWAAVFVVPITLLEIVARMPWMAAHLPALDYVKYLIYPGYKITFVVMGDVRADTFDYKILQPILGGGLNVLLYGAAIYGVAWAMGKTEAS